MDDQTDELVLNDLDWQSACEATSFGTECTTPAVWALRCDTCGSSPLLCSVHKGLFIALSYQLVSKCEACDGNSWTWVKL